MLTVAPPPLNNAYHRSSFCKMIRGNNMEDEKSKLKEALTFETQIKTFNDR